MLLPQQRRRLIRSMHAASSGHDQPAILNCSADQLAELIQLWGAEESANYGATIEFDADSRTVAVSSDAGTHVVRFRVSHK